ncbi:MAG: hypothetical protein J6T87_08060 [Bacteroidales bacterium]|nr:hypothetical protein [Bacteroidales bacterium]
MRKKSFQQLLQTFDAGKRRLPATNFRLASLPYRKQRNPQAQTQPYSKCTIPFGLPPKSKTTHTSDTHRLNGKCRHRPAKRNLRPARAGNDPFIVSS